MDMFNHDFESRALLSYYEEEGYAEVHFPCPFCKSSLSYIHLSSGVSFLHIRNSSAIRCKVSCKAEYSHLQHSLSQ